jgi:hypothetical protein
MGIDRRSVIPLLWVAGSASPFLSVIFQSWSKGKNGKDQWGGVILVSGAFEKLLEAYPYLSQEDILACIGYGAAMSREHFVNINIATA